MIRAMLEWKLMGERSRKTCRKRWLEVMKEDFNKKKGAEVEGDNLEQKKVERDSDGGEKS